MLYLLAQTNGGGPTDAEVAAAAGAMAAAVFVAVGVILLVMFIINIVICAMLYSAQKRIPAEFQTLAPGLVWLLLIPLFNLVWNFLVFQKIPESYQRYFASQSRTDVGDCGRAIGLWYAITGAVSLISGFIPCVGMAVPLASLVLLVLFLVKIMGLKGQVGGPGPVAPPAG